MSKVGGNFMKSGLNTPQKIVIPRAFAFRTSEKSYEAPHTAHTFINS